MILKGLITLCASKHGLNHGHQLTSDGRCQPLSTSIGEANLSNNYCPNITYVVSVLSQFMHEPHMVHWESALGVLAYIKRAPGKGLIYQRHDHLRIEAYSDARYARDKGDQKSTTGYCTYDGGNLVTWCSRK